MNEPRSLYIEQNDCTSCYRCLRECPVKAIKCHGDSVTIDYDKCIRCGDCVSKCKYGYINVRNDVYIARKLIKSHLVKVASVSPQWSVEFPGIDESRFIEALHLLGFTNVSESALGAQAIIESEAKTLMAKNEIFISSRCPVVSDYIRKYKSKIAYNILPYVSPMVAHARMIKSWWGAKSAIIHISSCQAAKREAESSSDLINISLTFKELKSWFHDEGVDFEKVSGHESYMFEPHVAKNGLMYALEGGTAYMIKNIGCTAPSISKSSMAQIKSLLAVVPEIESDGVFLDLMACDGGCVGSCGSSIKKHSLVNAYMHMRRIEESRKRIADNYILPPISVFEDENITTTPISRLVSENHTLKALSSIGIMTEAEQIDCNACGYNTCRRFAKALSKGLTTKDMCSNYMRNNLQTKLTTLIENISIGIAIIDKDMTILNSNTTLSTMFGLNMEQNYDSKRGLSGLDADTILPFSRYVRSMLEGGEDNLVKDIQIKERIITVSLYKIERNKTILAICRNMLFSQVRNEEIVTRTKKVVKENLETVQKIASLLGENASRTEAILNSILDSQGSK